MGSKKSADTRCNASNSSSSWHSGERTGVPPGPLARIHSQAHNAFTSLTSRVREDLASPKSIEVFGP